MYIKQRQLPLQVSSWMEKDVSLRKVTANSRLITNDTRQNIVLSRRFFTDLFTLSVTRHRKLTEHDHDQRRFVRQQLKKSQVSLPGLLPYVTPFAAGIDQGGLSIKPTARMNASASSQSFNQSILSPLESQSDPSFNRQMKRAREAQTAKPLRSRSDIIPMQSGRSVHQSMTRERLNRLALPKGTRINLAGNAHIRSNAGSTIITNGILPKSDETATDSQLPPETKKSGASDDRRFRSLFGVFSEVHDPRGSHSRSVEKIVRANSSLRDDQGRWITMNDKSKIDRKAELRHQRQMVVNQLHRNVDIFLINVAA